MKQRTCHVINDVALDASPVFYSTFLPLETFDAGPSAVNTQMPQKRRKAAVTLRDPE
jgi:hypothetical protein